MQLSQTSATTLIPICGFVVYINATVPLRYVASVLQFSVGFTDFKTTKCLCAVILLHYVPLYYCIICRYVTALYAIILLHYVPLCYCIMCRYITALCTVMLLHYMPLYYCIMCRYVTALCVVMLLHYVPLYYCIMKESNICIDLSCSPQVEFVSASDD